MASLYVWGLTTMALPNESQEAASGPTAALPSPRMLTEAVADFERGLLRATQVVRRGNSVEPTVDQIEHCVAKGESPWHCESIS